MEIKINDSIINYEVKYKNNKRIYLRVRDGMVSITAPYFTPSNKITEMIRENINQIIPLLKTRDFQLWGQKYEVENIKATYNKVLVESKIICYYKTNYVTVMKNFLTNELKQKINCFLEKNEDKIKKNDLVFKELKIREMKSRWGSCHTLKRLITINLNLVYYEEKYLEYVLWHELAHLKHPNHQALFHQFLETLCPNAKNLKKEMKKCY